MQGFYIAWPQCQYYKTFFFVIGDKKPNEADYSPWPYSQILDKAGNRLTREKRSSFFQRNEEKFVKQ